MFRSPLCPSSGASQLHMQSLVPIDYNNTCCLQICHYVHFIITANYLCDTYKPFSNLYVCFVLFCFFVVALWGLFLVLYYCCIPCGAWFVVSSSPAVFVTAAFSCVCGSVLFFSSVTYVLCLLPTVLLDRIANCIIGPYPPGFLTVF